jgi:hypothetical protein
VEVKRSPVNWTKVQRCDCAQVWRQRMSGSEKFWDERRKAGVGRGQPFDPWARAADAPEAVCYFASNLAVCR